MEKLFHSLASLFDQLGLESTDQGIDAFIAKNGPLPGNVALPDATFWSTSQASLLKQKIDEDADWSGFVDQLDALLR